MCIHGWRTRPTCGNASGTLSKGGCLKRWRKILLCGCVWLSWSVYLYMYGRKVCVVYLVFVLPVSPTPPHPVTTSPAAQEAGGRQCVWGGLYVNSLLGEWHQQLHQKWHPVLAGPRQPCNALLSFAAFCVTEIVKMTFITFLEHEFFFVMMQPHLNTNHNHWIGSKEFIDRHFSFTWPTGVVPSFLCPDKQQDLLLGGDHE